MENERRRENIQLEVYIAKFDDFLEGTKEYRKAQDTRLEAVRSTLETTTRELIKEMRVTSEALLKMPCAVHREKINNLEIWRGVFVTLIIIIVGGMTAFFFKK